MPFLTVSLATLLFGVTGVSVALMIVAAAGSVMLIGGDTLLGRFFISLEQQVLFFQIYLVTLLVSALPIAFLLAQRADALRELAAARARAERDTAEVRILAETDPLTGIANRRRILADLAGHLAHAEDEAAQVSVAMIDVDHFKAINDRCGHTMGDHVLRLLAAMLRGTLSPGERVGRIGGEEFLVIIPDKPAEELSARCRQIRERLAAVEWPGDGPDAVTLSIGIAEWQPGWGETELLRAADRALYQAKDAGRDRCIVYAGEPSLLA